MCTTSSSKKVYQLYLLLRNISEIILEIPTETKAREKLLIDEYATSLAGQGEGGIVDIVQRGLWIEHEQYVFSFYF